MLTKAFEKIQTVSDIIDWLNQVKQHDEKEIAKNFSTYIDIALSKVKLLPDFYKINYMVINRKIDGFELNPHYKYEGSVKFFIDFIDKYIGDTVIKTNIEFLFLKNLFYRTRMYCNKLEHFNLLNSILIKKQKLINEEGLLTLEELLSFGYYHVDFERFVIPVDKLTLGKNKYHNRYKLDGKKKIYTIYEIDDWVCPDKLIYSYKNGAIIIHPNPIVELNNNILEVVGNQIYYKAAQKSKIKYVICLLDKRSFVKTNYENYSIRKLDFSYFKNRIKTFIWLNKIEGINEDQLFSMLTSELSEKDKERVVLKIHKDLRIVEYYIKDNKPLEDETLNIFVLWEYLENNYGIISLNGYGKNNLLSNENWD